VLSYEQERSEFGVVPAQAGTQSCLSSCAGHTIQHRRRHQLFHVYILASKRNGTLYIGVTNDIAARLDLHRQGKGSEFVQRYSVYNLVYVESYTHVEEALQREKQLKKWNRAWKLRLIEQDNPEWRDLTDFLI
jgi:putative endonuclease